MEDANSQWRMPIAVEEKKGTKFEIEKQMKGAKEERKKTKEEDEPFWKEKNESAKEEWKLAGREIAGCTGEERKRGRRKGFFKKNILTFIF